MILNKKLLAFALCTSASLPAAAFQLQHGQGVLTLDEPPQQVVSYDLGHLDTLNALGIPVAGVPKSIYSGALAKYQDAPVVGTLFEPDYAALRKLAPDLVITGGRSEPATRKLNEIAPAVSFEYDPGRFLASVKAASLAIGDAWGKRDLAEQAFAKIERNVDELKTINKDKTGALLFVVKGNVIAHAPGDRFGYLHELTGLAPVLPPKEGSEATQSRPEPGSPEAKAASNARAKIVSDVAKADPDWLVVLDRGAINNGEKTAKDTLAKHPEISQTRAFREGRVYYVDPNSWYIIGGGLNNLHAITERLITAMGPRS